MNISLKVHYRLAAIPMIRSFVTEAAAYYGADSREVFELGMAAEEAAEHIITTYPAAEAQAPFDIFCEEKEDALRFIFSNTGLPVNVDAIPTYDVGNPETSIDGLQFFLLEKLTDDFRFVNLGGGGWQTVIDKKLKGMKTYDAGAAVDAGSEESLDPSGKLELSLALPEDAYEITKLAYHTYRYSYAKKVFYYPEMLKEELTSRQVISFILKNEQDEIIGHSAPAFNPLPTDFDDDLKSLGFFFSGILARTPENWQLLYTCLNNQELDFSGIKLCEDIAMELRDYVRSCCESLE